MIEQTAQADGIESVVAALGLGKPAKKKRKASAKKKPAAKKATAKKKPAAKKATAKKATAKKATAKKKPAAKKKAVAKKPAAKKATAKKATAKKATAKKKPAAKKATAKKKPVAKKKAVAKKPAAKKKVAAKKAPAKKAAKRKVAKKAVAKKPAAKKKAVAKKAPAKRKAVKKTTAKKGAKTVKKLQDEPAVSNKLLTNTGSSKTTSTSASFNNGIEGLSTAFVSYAQNQLEETMLAIQHLLNCRTLEEMAEVQSQFMHDSFDRFIAETSKMAQTTANLAKESAVPFSDQMEDMMNRMSRAA